MSDLKRLKREYKLELMRKWIYISAFSFLLFIGISLLFINTVYSHISNKNHVENVIETTNQMSSQQIEVNKAVIENSSQKDLNTTVVSQSNLESSTEVSDIAISYEFGGVTPVSSISHDPLNTNLVIGQLYFPELDINVPILEGVSKENLNNGAGTLKPGQDFGTGNYALASFNVDEKAFLFSNLVHAAQNQIIYLSDKEMVYEYIVSNIYKNEDTLEPYISDNEGTVLTLVTHNSESDTHFIVEADYKYSYSINDSTSDIKETFLPE